MSSWAKAVPLRPRADGRGVALPIAIVASIAVVVSLAVAVLWPGQEPYVRLTDGTPFTHGEYHDRIRGQLERSGYGFVCLTHLGSITWPNEDDANGRRMVEIIIEECNDVSLGRRPL